MASFPLFQFPEDIVFEFTRHLPPRDLKAFLFTSKTSLRIGRPALHILPLDKLRRALEWTVAMERTDATLEFLRYNSRLLARNPDLGSDPLYSACRADNVSLVRDLLNVRVSPNAPAIKHHEYPPLAMAVIQNRVEVVRLLMAAGGTLKSCNFAENYSVLCTGKGEHLNMAQILIKHGFDIHQLDENGNSFIHHACTKPAPGMDTIFNIQLLLDLGLDINQTNHDGETPMALAVKSRLLKVTEFLLGQGADPNIGMNDGHSPLHAAFSNQQDPDNLVKALLSGGALISEPSMPEFVRDAWVSDWSHSLATLLSVWKLQVASAPCSDPDLMFCAAATVGDIPLLQDLLQRGRADPNCEIEKRTALVSAARAAKDDVIEFLIPHVSNFDNTSWRGGTALHCAIRDGTDETIHLLLPHTKRIVTTNQGRLAPLFDAVRYRSVDIVSLLLEKMLSREQTRTALASKEVDLRETSDIFYRPGKVIPCALACAVWEQKLEVTRLLLQQTEYLGPQRADPSFLCTAMEKGYDDIAVELVKWGIALPRPDGNDRTPLIVAVDSGLTGMVQALIDRGVDLEARGRFHDTALTVAVQKNSAQAVVSLLAAGAYPYRRMHFKDHDDFNQAMRNSELCLYSPGTMNIFFHAVRNGYNEIVRALMPLFDVNQAEPYFGRTVLHIAVDRTWVDTIRVLLANKKVDVHCTDVFDRTPLDVALDSGFIYPRDVIAGLSGDN